jgi:hypothetical protein
MVTLAEISPCAYPRVRVLAPTLAERPPLRFQARPRLMTMEARGGSTSGWSRTLPHASAAQPSASVKSEADQDDLASMIQETSDRGSLGLRSSDRWRSSRTDVAASLLNPLRRGVTKALRVQGGVFKGGRGGSKAAGDAGPTHHGGAPEAKAATPWINLRCRRSRWRSGWRRCAQARR